MDDLDARTHAFLDVETIGVRSLETSDSDGYFHSSAKGNINKLRGLYVLRPTSTLKDSENFLHKIKIVICEVL